jgi:hypothetical protein
MLYAVTDGLIPLEVLLLLLATAFLGVQAIFKCQKKCHSLTG